MPRKRAARGLLFVAVLTATALFGTACSSSSNSGDAATKTTSVKIGVYPGLFFSLMIEVAKEKGLFTKNHINPDFISLNTGPAIVSALASGSISFGENSSDNLLLSHKQGVNVKAVVGNVAHMPYEVMVSNRIKTDANAGYPAVIQSLKGARLVVAARGSSNELIWGRMLADAGLKPSDVTFVVAPPSTFNAVLKAGQADAILAIPPQGAVCKAEKLCHQILAMNAGEGPADLTAVPYNTWWSTTDYIKAHPDVVRNFQQTIIDADRYIHDPKNLDAVLKVADNFLPSTGITTEQLNQEVGANLKLLNSSIAPTTAEAWSKLLVSGNLLPAPIAQNDVVLTSAPTTPAS